MAYKKNNPIFIKFRFKKKEKKSFLIHFLTFSIVGVFSFSLGCSKGGDRLSLYSQAGLSFRVDPLKRSGVNERRVEYPGLRSKNPISSKLSLRSFGKLNPLSNLVVLQQAAPPEEHSQAEEEGVESSEEKTEHESFCNLETLNKVSEIVQQSEFYVRNEATGKFEKKDALHLDYATHSYLENQVQDCIVGLYVNQLFSRKTEEVTGSLTVNTIESDADEGNRKDFVTWAESSESEETQARGYSQYLIENVIGQDGTKKEIVFKQGVDFILKRENEFKKWVYFINTIVDETEGNNKDFRYEVAQKMFFLARVNENDEEEHITGSIRFQNRQHTFTISKSIAHVGTVVHHKKYNGSGERGSDDNTFATYFLSTDMPDCTPPNPANKMTTKFYNSDGTEMTESDDEEFSDFKAKFGNHNVSDLVSLLPNEALKTSLNNIENANAPITNCGFNPQDITKAFDYANFSFTPPAATTAATAGDETN